jgi:hypothetical protein
MFVRSDTDDPARAAHARRIRGWLAPFFHTTEAEISVAELTSDAPGLPPVETVIVHRAEDGEARQLSIYKPLLLVTRSDAVGAFMATQSCSCSEH